MFFLLLFSNLLNLIFFQQFAELEGNAQFKGQLRELYITGAKVWKIDFYFQLFY
jgi:hypothetical protein